MVMIGCIVFLAKGDVDVDIANVSVYSAREYSTAFIRTDTDLRIFFLHYAEFDGKPLYFRSNNQSKDISNVYHQQWEIYTNQ